MAMFAAASTLIHSCDAQEIPNTSTEVAFWMSSPHEAMSEGVTLHASFSVLLAMIIGLLSVCLMWACCRGFRWCAVSVDKPKQTKPAAVVPDTEFYHVRDVGVQSCCTYRWMNTSHPRFVHRTQGFLDADSIQIENRRQRVRLVTE